MQSLQTRPAGAGKPPLPGQRVKKIYNEVSQRAWDEWQELQTMLINEKHLSLIDPDARSYLSDQRRRFFNNEPVDRAEGFVPSGDG